MHDAENDTIDTIGSASMLYLACLYTQKRFPDGSTRFFVRVASRVDCDDKRAPVTCNGNIYLQYCPKEQAAEMRAALASNIGAQLAFILPRHVSFL